MKKTENKTQEESVEKAAEAITTSLKQNLPLVMADIHDIVNHAVSSIFPWLIDEEFKDGIKLKLLQMIGSEALKLSFKARNKYEENNK